MSAPERPLAALLDNSRIDAGACLALRVRLHPEDVTTDFPTLAALVETGHLVSYARMQDGAVLGQSADVLVFAAETDGHARLIAHLAMRARPPGIAPGDLVYDPAIADLLHGFISRSQTPVFYDADAREDLGASPGVLRVRWPDGDGDVVPLSRLL